MSDRIFTGADGRKYINNEPRLGTSPRKPLTDEQIHNLYLHMSGKSEGLLEAGSTADFPVMFARAVEEMHGIGEKE